MRAQAERECIVEKKRELVTCDLAEFCARAFGLVNVLQKPRRTRVAVAAGNAFD
jgi:hypothetical protein